MNLLFLSHRLPYPPDKGEKIRAWHLFAHLAKTHRMHLGCLVDAEADWAHVPFLRAMCADIYCARHDKRRQKIRAVVGLRPGRALTLDYFHDAGLQSWVDTTLDGGRIDRIVVFSSGMADYVMREREYPDRTLDMVDVDSEKFRDYAARTAGPARLVWSREGRLLLAFERRAAQVFDRTLLVSDAECARFAELAPESRGRVAAVENGVDLERFSPRLAFDNPYDGGPNIVFTGTMDYWPNEDAVAWFARAVLPGIRAQRPDAAFHIVGANPTPAVTGLARLPGVAVTGRVADVRPYLAYADVAVAPLRIARGIQNKLLEAMAMGRPVVASPEAFEGVRAAAGRDLLVADGDAATREAVLAVLDGRHPDIGSRGRAAVERGYAWAASLARLDALLAPALEEVAP